MIDANVRPKKLFDNHLPTHLYQNIKKGDIVWIRTTWLPQFVKKILPTISKPFILVTGDADDSIPFHFRKETALLLQNRYVVKWFTQNLDITKIKHPKLEYIPIGLDFHTLLRDPKTFNEAKIASVQSQEQELFRLISSLPPTTERICKIHYDAHLVDRNNPLYVERFGDTRQGIASILKKKGESVAILQQERMPRHLYFAEKGRYAFSIAIYGMGLDCHRTWENLILGHIVIAKSTSLDPLFKGLPVVIIQDWDEITEENLKRWLEKYGDVFHNPYFRKQLTHRYWMNKIIAAKKLC